MANNLDHLGKSVQQLLDKLAMLDRAVKSLGSVPGGGGSGGGGAVGGGGSAGTGGVGSSGNNVLSGSLANVATPQENRAFARSMVGTTLKTIGGVAAGAAGVGVGSAVNRLDDELAMVAVVRALREALPAAVVVHGERLQ